MKKLCFILLSYLFCIQLQSSFADEWKRVYLASYPRSGNHWIRYLVEEATGIATSSVYRDILNESKSHVHLAAPFSWGGYAPNHGYEGNRVYPTKSDTVLLKTHFPSKPKVPFDGAPSIKSIRILRHPVDSFYSLYVFRNGEPADGIIPTEVVKKFIASWRTFQNYWNKDLNTVTLRYEDLCHEPVFVLNEILKAMGYILPLSDIKRAVQKYPPKYRKNVALEHAEHFKEEDLRLIASELKGLMGRFGYTIPLNEDR